MEQEPRNDREASRRDPKELSSKTLEERIKQSALALGFQAVGFTKAAPPPHFEAYASWIGKGYQGSMDYLEKHLPLKRDPRLLLPEAKSVITVALNYNQPNPVRAGYPRIARYALGRDYHKVMRHKLRRLSAALKALAPECESKICVDSSPVLERDFAQLAGIGWYGKNTCLIDSKRGSWFFIGIILTTVDLAPDEPAIGACGTCRMCIDACPTGAIVHEEDRWQIDARRCISYLTIEHKGALSLSTSGWTFGCDVCQEVCPFNEPRDKQPDRGIATFEPDFARLRDWPTLRQLRQLPYEAWDDLTRGSAVRRAGYESLRRNAEACLSDP